MGAHRTFLFMSAYVSFVKPEWPAHIICLIFYVIPNKFSPSICLYMLDSGPYTVMFIEYMVVVLMFVIFLIKNIWPLKVDLTHSMFNIQALLSCLEFAYIQNTAYSYLLKNHYETICMEFH